MENDLTNFTKQETKKTVSGSIAGYDTIKIHTHTQKIKSHFFPSRLFVKRGYKVPPFLVVSTNCLPKLGRGFFLFCFSVSF